MPFAIAALLCTAVLLPFTTVTAQIDPSGSWRTWHTEHFRVHAHENLRPHAVHAAREAERAYGLLASELTPPRGTIDLILTDATDISNAFAVVEPSNRIVVYLPPAANGIPIGRYDIWLRLVITHELTHIFHFDRTKGVWRVLQAVFGRAPGLFPNTYQPPWVTEGLATYYESRFTAGGRSHGTFYDQLLTAAAVDGRWPRPGDVTFLNRRWPAAHGPYAWGSRFFSRLDSSAVPEFVERTSGQLIPFNVSAPLEAVGESGVNVEWRQLAHANHPDIQSRSIIDRGLREEPRLRLSPSGSWIAYRRRTAKSPERLSIRHTADGSEWRSRRTNLVDDLTWIGDTLFVTQIDFVSPVELRYDVYRWEPDGSWNRVSVRGRHTDVFEGPGGELGLVTLRDGGRHVSLQTPERASNDDGFAAPAADNWGRIVVSADDEWVAGSRHADHQWDIVLWKTGKLETIRAVTNDIAFDGDPTWSHDGRYLLFTSERDGVPQIYGYDMSTARTFRMTNEPMGAREPALGSDGTLLYSTTLSDGFAIVQQPAVRFTPAPGSTDTNRLVVDDAPIVAIRQTGFAPWSALRPYFWMPIGHHEDESGMFLGALTSGVDAIGRTSYTTLSTVAPGSARWEGAFSLVHQRWRSWSVDFAAGQTWDFAGFVVSQDTVFQPVSFRERSAEAGLSYRWRRWRTSFGVRLGAFIEQDALVNDSESPLPFVPRNPLFGGGIVSARLATSESGDFSISHENGATVRGLYLRRWELDGPGWSYEARGGVDTYLALPLPGFAHWVLATRVTAGVTGGPLPGVFTIGGVSGDALGLLPGYTLGSGRRSFPLRGYPRSGQLFTRAFVGIAELRIPILIIGRGLWRLPVLLDRVSMTVFGEVGGAWTDEATADIAQFWNVGGELAVDIGVGVGFALRTRAGVAVPLTDGLGVGAWEPRVYLAFGPSF